MLTACESEARLRQAHEVSAIQELKTIASAEVQYYSQTGHYGGRFAELGIAEPDPDGGYVYRMAMSPAGFEAHANPVEFGKTGSRCFYADQSLVIRQSTTKDSAGPNSPAVQ